MVALSEQSRQLSLAQAAYQSGRIPEAEAQYASIVKRWPDCAEAFALLGAIKLQLGKTLEAIDLLLACRKLSPSHVSAITNLGYAFYLVKKYDEAFEVLECALALAPDSFIAHNTRGLVIATYGRFDDALGWFERSLALKPDYFEAINNRANMLLKLGRRDEAIAGYKSAIDMRPDDATGYFNLGRAYMSQNQINAAVQNYDTAIAKNPADADAYWGKAMANLLAGDFETGWKLYEWRWRSSTFNHAPRNFPQPLWLGDFSIAGKTILVHAEQGFGDTLQFCRYLPLVVEQGAEVLFIVQPELIALMRSSNLKCILLLPGDPLPRFDVHCPLLSLPLALRTTLETIPSHTPYVQPSGQRIELWRNRLGQRQRLRVGVAWSGRKTHLNNKNRSIALHQLAPLLALDAEFHCLQNEIDVNDQSDISLLERLCMIDLVARDFADTAAYIQSMDVVISVDTSIAHLAGALAKPIWILLPFAPDFRWLLGRKDSPWYPSAKLIRQNIAGDWSNVISTVAANLSQLMMKPL